MSPPSNGLFSSSSTSSGASTTSNARSLSLRTTSSSTGSSASASPTNATAYLKATILSAYDLPIREPPLFVQVSVTGLKSSTPPLRTGPPSQRHKDRNSFKFDDGYSSSSTTSNAVGRSSTSATATTAATGSASSSSTLTIVGPNLQSLYKESVVIELQYESHPLLKATYALNQLRIHEPTWLILPLQQGSSSSNNNTKKSSTTATTTASAGDDASGGITPTIRLQLTLVGPYRAEISAVVGALGVWFSLIQRAETSSQQAITQIHQKVPIRVHMDPKWLLVPAVPVAAIAIVSAPVVLGIMTVGLPVFLPFLVLAGLLVAGAGCTMLAIWGSTTQGRNQIKGVIGPLASSLLQTKPMQQLLYATGPRPSPVTVAQTITPTGMHQKLLWSLSIDAIGSGSYLIPIVGESFDMVWAPLQTILIMALYNDVAPNLKYVSFMEEFLPLTDIIPSATMGWLTEFGIPFVLQQLKLDGVGSTNNRGSALVTTPERTGVTES